MNKFKYLFILIGFGFLPLFANAQSKCIRVDQIAKWEVLDSDKTIVYDSQGNSIAFVVFYGMSLKKSGETFRFFSPTVCQGDRVQTSSRMDMIQSIEPIRR